MNETNPPRDSHSEPSTEAVTLSSRLAAKVITELIHRGVRDLVVCPGSRSQALALAAAEAEQHGLARLHVRIDERSAAFFALGIARETGIPAPVIVTSGSAVANLMPAALEAHHARVPMILLSADRPAELRGIRSSQTVTDNSFMQTFCRYATDIVAADPQASFGDTQPDAQPEDAQRKAGIAYTSATAHPSGAGPTHLNIGFRDPLSGGTGLVAAELALLGTERDTIDPDAGDFENLGSEFGAEFDPDHEPPTATVELDLYVHGADGETPLTVVVAGADAGPEAEAFAHTARLPLFAEPSSGARFGREAVQHWVQLLNEHKLSELIEQVIVFGHPTLTRDVPALVQRAETVVIDQAGPEGLRCGIERYNPGRTVSTFARSATVTENYDRAKLSPWLGAWITEDRELRAAHTTVHEPDLEAALAPGYKERSAYARTEVARLREPVTREHLTETLWRATWPHDRLVLASSRLIRVLNRTAAPRKITVHANRGLAGIDGTIATAFGVATASQSHDNPRLAAGTTRLLIGDLALFHDVGSLALPNDEMLPRLQLIVGNDGGGTIFDQLEVAASADPDIFDRVMLTPQHVDIAALAAAYGWAYSRVDNQGELERAFTVPVEGPSIIEVPLARQ